MFKLTIEGATFEELKTAVAGLAQQLGAASAAGNRPAATKAPAADPVKEAAPGMDYKKDVGPLILQLADKSRDKAVELLSKFSVKKGTELKPSQFADFIAAAKAAIEAAENDLG